jgi:hypothetical protein
MLIAFCIGIAIVATGALVAGRIVLLRGIRKAEKNDDRPFDS